MNSRIYLFLLLCIIHTAGIAQKFTQNGGPISDYQGFIAADTFNINVSGLPNRIDKDFGLASVCFNIQHKRVSDLKVELFAPGGAEIWLTNRNGGDDGANYFFTCFRSDGFSGYIHEGAAPFKGEFIPDGRMEYINNGQNPNGQWKLLIRDLQEGISGSLDYVTLQFETNPMPNYDTPTCTLADGKGCGCPDGYSNCELLPDLVILPSFTENQIKEYAFNHYKYPGQLRLAASIANIGIGPMETMGSGEWFCGDTPVSGSLVCPNGEYSRQQLVQRIYSKNGIEISFKDIPTGTNYFDDKPGHDHFHVDDWVEFRLVKQKKKKAKIVASGQKVSYCLFDTGICTNADSLCMINGQNYGNKNLINYGLGNFPDCKDGVQGISVGGYDTYGMMYEGQFIQLPKGLKSGVYTLEIEIDPEHKYYELDKTNNIYRQEVTISKQRKR